MNYINGNGKIVDPPFELSELLSDADFKHPSTSNLPLAASAVGRLEPIQEQVRHPTPLESMPWGYGSEGEARGGNQDDCNPFLGFNAFQNHAFSQGDSLVADKQSKLDRLDNIVLGMNFDPNGNVYSQNLLSNSSNMGMRSVLDFY